MPVFYNRQKKRSADVGDVAGVKEWLEKLQLSLKRYIRVHISDFPKCSDIAYSAEYM